MWWIPSRRMGTSVEVIARAINTAGPGGAAPGNDETRLAGGLRGTATGIRTPVSAVRGRRPSPLDDSGRNRLRRVAKGVRLRGLEPPRGCPHMDLNHACIPISPQP